MKFKYVLRKAVKADIITINPIDKLDNDDKPKDEEGTREFLTVDEIKKLIVTSCKNDILRRAFLFCCLVGLRYSDVLSLGTPIETVSKMMGHTKIATTQIYAKIIDKKQKEAVNRQNGIFD